MRGTETLVNWTCGLWSYGPVLTKSKIGSTAPISDWGLVMTLTSSSTACSTSPVAWCLRNYWRWGGIVERRSQFLRREGRLYCLCNYGRNGSVDIHGHCAWWWTWRVWSNHVGLLSCSALMNSGRLLSTQSWPPGSLVGASGWNGGGRCSLRCVVSTNWQEI